MPATLLRANDPLLQPYTIKHLTLRNRIMSTAHEPNYHEDGMPKDRYRLYHVEKAKGGIALTMTAGSAVVSRDSPPAFGNLLAYKDEIVPWLAKLADECHTHGAAVMIQLTHLGRRTNWNKADWLPVLSASPVREPAHRAFPKEMEDWDIERIVADYASAAERMKAAGLDGFEFECYGHLMDAFWSPATNQRDDLYNGSIDNRLRFTMRVLEAVRKAVGPDFLVGCRLVADEDWDKGLSKAEGLEICHRLKASGLVDFLNIIRGHIEHDAPLAKVIPVAGMQAAPHLDFAGEVRAATKFPVFHAARINDVATARHAIAEGKLDMVGMTRAHIADPHIARKIAEGREADIRPCVGATYCLDRIYEGHEALCIHNPATGREAQMPHVVAKAQGPRRRIAVIGAGPAGLEAARVTAARGHEVTLFEASGNPGGQIRLAAQAKRRRELIAIADWRAEQCERLGVAMKFNQLVEASDIRDLGADVVIVATGGLPQNVTIEEGADLAVSSWDILSGDVKPADDVLLYDDNGAHPGMAAAELIAEAGASLEILSPERFFAPEMGGLNLVPYMKTFTERQVRITTMTRLRALKRQGNKIQAVLWSPYSETDSATRLVDQVVVENATAPLADLYFDLKEESSNRGEVDYEAFVAGRPQTKRTNPSGRFQLFRIGDAVASRNIHAAIYDALRLCVVL
ncbi:FAD-dependent oxidoreductase [Aestuariivirga sp. YIM B02566]|uniref:FAD-dependent oxidoreductase n=1 Tax=Taklimakanibacter albus TaxID=2800327 RepID=A0ACC5QY46_9HYPH|nr:FAD-dependent oxidoreductase [Aestuariivirga sp. YIM B02566]